MAEGGAEDASGRGFRRLADGDGVDHLPFCAVCFDAGFHRFEVVESVFALVGCVVGFASTPLADEAERLRILSAVALVRVSLVGTLVLSVVSVPTRARLF